MIKKLRRKFVLSNMALVSIVLVMVFIAVCLFYQQILRAATEEVLRQSIAIRNGQWHKPMLGVPMQKPRMEHIPSFSVMIDAEGNIQDSFGRDNVSISDSALIEAVSQVQNPGYGTLPELSLRYLCLETPDGTRIAFADSSHERASMRNLIFISLAVGVLALCAFLGISVFLARQTLRPVEEAWAQQRRFIADASHELKTPLTVILANLGVLLAHPDEPIRTHRQWVDNSREEAVRMKGLVEDLLFLARSDSGQAPMVTERLNLSDLLWGSLLSFEPVAFEEGTELNSSIDEDIFIMGAANQLQQLFAILLDNAIKYAGEHGKVWVILMQKENHISFSVRNTGEPIPQEYLPHIFDRFYRIDAARTRERGGYGLGLSIAQCIAEGHGGHIAAESRQELGTRFQVTLPPAP